MRLFVTGFTSSLVSVMISQLDDIEIIEIGSETNRKSTKMSFDTSTLNTFEECDYILHCSWKMEERSKLKSEKIYKETEY